MKPRTLLTAFAALLLAFSSVWGRVTGVEEYHPSSHHTHEGDVLAHYNFLREQVGYLLYDPKARSVRAKRNPSKSFIPASVTKILTTLAALEILGHEYRFPTQLKYQGQMARGEIHGDLYLKGTGDPALSSSDLMQMVQVLESRGVRAIRGKFVYDESALFQASELDEGFEPDGSWNSGISALSTEFNRLAIHWRPSARRGRVEAFLTPSLPSVRLGLADEPPPGTSTFAYEPAEDETLWRFSPKAAPSGNQYLPARDAGRYTAGLFAKLARMSGIEIPEPERGTTPRAARVLALHQSPTLLELCKGLLEYSNNLTAELIMLAAAKRLTGESQSLEASAQTTKEWLQQHIPALQDPDFQYWNGSGLTSKNRLSPVQAVAALGYADRRWRGKTRYISLLPISGWTGTLRRRMVEPDTAFRIWAKTGSINYANAIAGYLNAESGRTLLFAIFVNDITRRADFEAKRDRHKPADVHAARRWNRRARAIEEDLLRLWIAKY
jgi:D-alanyl-D-alanine carboxypeptidase/D-alanyl-D-alanine-endopeptidase (penicillin-binding protein 4)